VTTFTPTENRPSSNPILVVKFGGSVLRDEKSSKQVADMLKKAYERGFRIVVVVSAMKGVTDQLLSMAKATNPNMPDDMLAEILSMGERTSARLMAASLNGKGLKAIFVDPMHELWPIISHGPYLDADVDLEKSAKLVNEKIVPLLNDGYVPVVCGFIGRNEEGKIQTLGRGGSDTTAVVLGNLLNAKEVILVKDVGGAFSADPKKASNAKLIKELDMEEAMLLSIGGSKLIHSKAFKYLKDNVKLRITSLSLDIDGGTVIQGVAPELEIEVSKNDISMVTLVGKGLSSNGSLSKITESIKNANALLHSISMDNRAIIAYVEGGKDVYGKVHEVAIREGLGKATSYFENLKEISIRGRALELEPGYIQKVTEPLGKEGINIYGMVTIANSIKLYLAEKDVEKAVKLIKQALGIEGREVE
jgi:aspartate kinase